MKLNATLYVTQSGSMRINKGTNKPQPREIAIRVNVTIPDRFFVRPVPTVDITIPESAVINSNEDIAIKVTAADLSEKLNLDVSAVEDGLAEMFRLTKEKNKITLGEEPA